MEKEVLKEAAKIRYGSDQFLWAKKRDAFIEGAKWQAERMYSEEEVVRIVQRLMYDVHCGDICEGDKIIDFKISPIKWFEQFKKK